MATKTLGVKFEIIGFKEALSSVKQFKLELRDTVKVHGQLLGETLKLNRSISKGFSSLQTSLRQGASSESDVEPPRRTPQISDNRNQTLPATSDDVAGFESAAKLISSEIRQAIQDENEEFIKTYVQIARKTNRRNLPSSLLKFALKPLNSILQGYYQAIGSQISEFQGRGFRQKWRNKKRFDQTRRMALNQSKASTSRQMLPMEMMMGQNHHTPVLSTVSRSMQPQLKSSNIRHERLIHQPKPDEFAETFHGKFKGLFMLLQNSLTKKTNYIAAGYNQSIGQHFGSRFATGISSVLKEKTGYDSINSGEFVGNLLAPVFKKGFKIKGDVKTKALPPLKRINQSYQALKAGETIGADRQLLPAGVRNQFGFIDQFVNSFKTRQNVKDGWVNKAKATNIFKEYESSEDKGATLDKVRGDYNQKARDFRQALKADKLELAAEIGEDILDYGDVIRDAYDQIINSLGKSDPIRKKVQGYKNYTAQVDKEIVQGQPNFRGRNKTGMVRRFDNHLVEQGKQVNDGLTMGVQSSLAKVAELGRAIGVSLTEGANQALGIKSPSKVFERIGLFVVAGFRKGIAGIDAVIKSTVGKIKTAMPTGSMTLQQKSKAKLILAEKHLKIKQQEEKLQARIDLTSEQKIKAKLRLSQQYLKLKQQEQRINATPINDRQLKRNFENKLKQAEVSLNPQTGKQVTQGLSVGIRGNLSRIDKLGKLIGIKLTQGTNQALGIKSPSKVFERIGLFVVAGFRKGVGRLGIDDWTKEEIGGDVEKLAAKFKKSPMDVKRMMVSVRKASKSVLGTFESAIKMGGNLLKTTTKIGLSFFKKSTYKGLILGGLTVAGLAGLALGFGKLLSATKEFRKEAVDTSVEMEALDQSILFMSRNLEEGAHHLKFASQKAKEFSVDIKGAKGAYSSLIGAAKDTPIEGEQLEQIFSAFAGSSANRGLNLQSQERLFTALSQIIGKRKLQAEEVKGQIGDILGFGDFQNLVADGLGVSSEN